MRVGQNVMCNGFPGTITAVCSGKLKGMIEVRLERGTVCVDATQVVLVDHGFNIKVTDYHRELVALYYGRLVRRFGLRRVKPHIPRLSRFVWTRRGLSALEFSTQYIRYE